MTTLAEYACFAVSAAAAMWLFDWLGCEHAPIRKCERLSDEESERAA